MSDEARKRAVDAVQKALTAPRNWTAEDVDRFLWLYGLVAVPEALKEACGTTMRISDAAQSMNAPNRRELEDAAIKARLALANAILAQLEPR
jgi:hypothetical protein